MRRPARLLAPLALALGGCGPGAPAKLKPVAPVTPAATLTPVAPAPKPGAVTPETPARPAIDALKLLKGNPSAKLLTPAFKKALTGKEGGAADWGAGLYAREIAEKLTPGEPLRAPEGHATLMVAPAGSERVIARVMPTADGPRFAWLQLVPAGPPISAAHLPATLPAAAFLGALTGNRPSLALDLLTPAARARLAPPRDDAEKALGYAPGILNLRLKSFRASATAFTLAPVADPSAVAATLGDRPVTLKLVKLGDTYAVDGFEAK